MKQNLLILIGLNVLVFLLQLGDAQLTAQLSLWLPFNPQFAQPWQWITHLFVHNTWFHLLVNMWMVWVFAPMLMYAYGTQKFAILYLGVGVFAGLVSVAWQSVQFYMGVHSVLYAHHLGASGAVFGLLGAFAVRFPYLPLRFLFFPKDIAARSLILGIVVYECFAQITGFSLFGAGIGHLAHIAGALAGFVLAKYWEKH